MAKTPPADATGATVEIRITDPAHLGQGIGRVDGRVFMVPFTAVGDLVRARVTADHRSWLRAVPLEIIEEGPGRAAPFCPVYGRCGGCHLQHLADKTRAAWKRGVFIDLMRRIGGIDIADVEYVESEPAGWRCRVGMHYDGTERDAGFFEASSHRLVPPGNCPIAIDPLAGLLGPVRSALRSTGWRDNAEVELVTGSDGRCVAVIQGENRPPDALHTAVRDVEGVNGVHSRGRGPRWKSQGDESILWPTAGICGQIEHMRVDPRGFTQAHMAMNPTLVETVIDHAGPAVDGMKVLELYGGAGNITLPLAMRGARVFATDINAPAVDAAAAACAAKGLAIATAAGRTTEVLAALPEEFCRPDVIIADPPRTGMGSDTAAIAAIRAPRAVICSCEPSALARDLKAFMAAGWGVRRVTLVDMFPSTYHMEAVISLTFQR